MRTAAARPRVSRNLIKRVVGAGLAALSNLQPVAVGILELRDVAPRELEHV
jgi:hypothetical protein